MVSIKVQRRMKAVLCGLLIAAACGGAGTLAGKVRRTESPPAHFVLPLRIQPLSETAVPLEATSATVRDERGGAARDIRVSLARTGYDVVYLRVADGESREIEKRTACYELRPATRGSSDAYRWAMWWDGPPPSPQLFWLVAVESGHSYLLFSNEGSLWMADVTRPRDRTLAFHEDLKLGSSQAVEHVPLRALFPEVIDNKWGFATFRQATRGIVEFVSLNEDAQGALVLTVKDPTGDDRALLKKESGEWRRLGYQSQDDAAGTR